MSGPVVVGFDGLAPARRAIRCGVDEALRRGCALLLCHAFTWPLVYPPLGSELDPHDRGPRLGMLHLLAEAAQSVRWEYPDLPVRTRLIDGAPGDVLVEASREADVLVVGHHGIGGVARLVATSVSRHAAAYAYCPVLVARGEPGPADAPIVLGFDGSPGARAAAVVAFAQARRRCADLIVVQVGATTAQHDASAMDVATVGLARTVDVYPDVNCHIEMVDGGIAATVLMATARRAKAGLLVVGCRGLGRVRALVVGSTSRDLIEHAPCPVMVAPPTLHSTHPLRSAGAG